MDKIVTHTAIVYEIADLSNSSFMATCVMDDDFIKFLMQLSSRSDICRSVQNCSSCQHEHHCDRLISIKRSHHGDRDLILNKLAKLIIEAKMEIEIFKDKESATHEQ